MAIVLFPPHLIDEKTGALRGWITCPRSPQLLHGGSGTPALLCQTPKIRVLIMTPFWLCLKTNISIFWVQPLIYSFRQISILCWHNHYSFCWSLLPWASLKHGQRCPGLFKDGRKATWPCIIWQRQLCSWLSHLNYNHKKRCARLHWHRLRAGTRNRFLNLPWVTAKGKQPPAGSHGPLTRGGSELH